MRYRNLIVLLIILAQVAIHEIAIADNFHITDQADSKTALVSTSIPSASLMNITSSSTTSSSTISSMRKPLLVSQDDNEFIDWVVNYESVHDIEADEYIISTSPLFFNIDKTQLPWIYLHRVLVTEREGYYKYAVFLTGTPNATQDGTIEVSVSSIECQQVGICGYNGSEYYDREEYKIRVKADSKPIFDHTTDSNISPNSCTSPSETSSSIVHTISISNTEYNSVVLPTISNFDGEIRYEEIILPNELALGLYPIRVESTNKWIIKPIIYGGIDIIQSPNTVYTLKIHDTNDIGQLGQVNKEMFIPQSGPQTACYHFRLSSILENNLVQISAPDTNQENPSAITTTTVALGHTNTTNPCEPWPQPDSNQCCKMIGNIWYCEITWSTSSTSSSTTSTSSTTTSTTTTSVPITVAEVQDLEPTFGTDTISAPELPSTAPTSTITESTTSTTLLLYTDTSDSSKCYYNYCGVSTEIAQKIIPIHDSGDRWVPNNGTDGYPNLGAAFVDGKWKCYSYRRVRNIPINGWIQYTSAFCRGWLAATGRTTRPTVPIRESDPPYVYPVNLPTVTTLTTTDTAVPSVSISTTSSTVAASSGVCNVYEDENCFKYEMRINHMMNGEAYTVGWFLSWDPVEEEWISCDIQHYKIELRNGFMISEVQVDVGPDFYPTNRYLRSKCNNIRSWPPLLPTLQGGRIYYPEIPPITVPSEKVTPIPYIPNLYHDVPYDLERYSFPQLGYYAVNSEPNCLRLIGYYGGSYWSHYHYLSFNMRAYCEGWLKGMGVITIAESDLRHGYPYQYGKFIQAASQQNPEGRNPSAAIRFEAGTARFEPHCYTRPNYNSETLEHGWFVRTTDPGLVAKCKEFAIELVKDGVGWLPVEWVTTTSDSIISPIATIPSTGSTSSSTTSSSSTSTTIPTTVLEVAPDLEPTFGTENVSAQVWTQNQAVTLTLPQATGGDGRLFYRLSPLLPNGLALTGRTISGTPTKPLPAILYTWSATDVDGDEVSLSFTIRIREDRMPTFGSQIVENIIWGLGQSVSVDLPSASGGDGILSYTLSPELPEGLALSGNTISGTTANQASFGRFKWTVTDSDGDTARLGFVIGVGPEPTFGTENVSTQIWTQNQAVTLTLPPATSGDGPLTYELSPTLPDGLTLTDRTITGTPTRALPATLYNWSVTDSDGDTVSLLFFFITVDPDLEPTFGTENVSTQIWTQNQAVTLTLPPATSGDGPLTYELSPTLPDGLTLTDKTITGTPTSTLPSTTYTWSVTDSDGDTVSLLFVITVDPDLEPTFGTENVSTQIWTQNQAVTLTLPPATSGNGPLTYELSPTLPDGLTLTDKTITGTPTSTLPSTTYTWSATDADGDRVSLSFFIWIGPIPTFGSQTIENIVWGHGQSVSVDLPSAFGGNGTLSYALIPELPEGLMLSGNTISGTTPDRASFGRFQWIATDTDGYNTRLRFTIRIGPEYTPETKMGEQQWQVGEDIRIQFGGPDENQEGWTYRIEPLLNRKYCPNCYFPEFLTNENDQILHGTPTAADLPFPPPIVAKNWDETGTTYGGAIGWSATDPEGNIRNRQWFTWVLHPTDSWIAHTNRMIQSICSTTSTTASIPPACTTTISTTSTTPTTTSTTTTTISDTTTTTLFQGEWYPPPDNGRYKTYGYDVTFDTDGTRIPIWTYHTYYPTYLRWVRESNCAPWSGYQWRRNDDGKLVRWGYGVYEFPYCHPLHEHFLPGPETFEGTPGWVPLDQRVKCVWNFDTEVWEHPKGHRFEGYNCSAAPTTISTSSTTSTTTPNTPTTSPTATTISRIPVSTTTTTIPTTLSTSSTSSSTTSTSLTTISTSTTVSITAAPNTDIEPTLDIPHSQRQTSFLSSSTPPPIPPAGDLEFSSAPPDPDVASVGDLAADIADTIVLSSTFSDTLNNTHQHHIEQLAQQGITQGCNPPHNTRFCPDRTITRAEIATLLTRTFNIPATDTDHFTDTNGNIHRPNINNLASAGIAQGCNPPTNTRYCPDRTITRAEIATLLTRALNLPIPTEARPYTDTVDHTHQDSITAISSAQIAQGCNPPSNTRYCPDRTLTRAEIATLLVRTVHFLNSQHH